MTLISATDLCRIAGIERNRLDQWLFRGVIARGDPAGWSIGEALAITLLARELDRNSSVPAASAVAVGKAQAVGAAIDTLLRGAPVERVTFLTATKADGTLVDQVVPPEFRGHTQTTARPVPAAIP